MGLSHKASYPRAISLTRRFSGVGVEADETRTALAVCREWKTAAAGMSTWITHTLLKKRVIKTFTRISYAPSRASKRSIWLAVLAILASDMFCTASQPYGLGARPVAKPYLGMPAQEAQNPPPLLSLTGAFQ